MEIQRPKVGVGVIVMKDDKVLLGKRKGKLGDGMWAFPGGHLEFGEEVFECASRETMEEAGIEITNLRTSTFTNTVYEREGEHYVALIVLADFLSGIPEVREPEKCTEWGWYAWDALPEPLLLTIQNLRAQNFTPFA